MLWYVATLSKCVLVEAPTYGQAKKKGRAEIKDRFGRGAVAVVRQATNDDISLHLLCSDVGAKQLAVR